MKPKSTQTPKLAFKPRRMNLPTPIARLNVKETEKYPYFPCLVFPNDPGSIEALHKVFVDAFVTADNNSIMAGIDAGLSALGFKTGGRK